MSLDEYLWRSRLSRRLLAERLGVSRGTVQGWLRFERTGQRGGGSFPPSPGAAGRLEKATGGAVRADQWGRDG